MTEFKQTEHLGLTEQKTIVNAGSLLLRSLCDRSHNFNIFLLDFHNREVKFLYHLDPVQGPTGSGFET